MKNSAKKSINLTASEYRLIDKALIVVLTIYNSDSEQFDYIKSRYAYLFDFIDAHCDLATGLCIKIHENR